MIVFILLMPSFSKGPQCKTSSSLYSSVHSSIEALRQTSYGHDNYALSWDARDTSSISMFRVYHEGKLQGTTLITNFTVGGLLPCQQHQAKVEALCGDGVLMNAKTVAAHTGNVETFVKSLCGLRK